MHLPAPIDLKTELPLNLETSTFIEESRSTIQRIFERQDSRLLCIVGPCSIHNVEEGLTFAKELALLQKEVHDSCFLVMRAYIEKPRTCGGWRGLVNDPHLNGSDDLSHGLTLSRSFLLELARLRVPVAVEFLTPHLAPYIQDLVSWGCIGARTSSSQIHRLLASSLPMPMGIKNTIDGNIESAISGVVLARAPHNFMHIDGIGKLVQIKSSGNPYTHVVLRGANSHSNFDSENIQSTLNKLRQLEIPARVLVDCSHGNSGRQYFKQKKAFEAVLEQVQEGNQQILGMMLECNLEASSQKIPSQLSDLQMGVSITDPCIDFASMAELIRSVSSSTLMSLTKS